MAVFQNFLSMTCQFYLFYFQNSTQLFWFLEWSSKNRVFMLRPSLNMAEVVKLQTSVLKTDFNWSGNKKITLFHLGRKITKQFKPLKWIFCLGTFCLRAIKIHLRINCVTFLELLSLCIFIWAIFWLAYFFQEIFSNLEKVLVFKVFYL